MHPGPGAMPADPATSLAGAELNSSDVGAAEETEVPEVATKPDGNGHRQTRRRWRLLQYLLGWIEAFPLGSSGGGGGGGSAEAEEALAAAAVALVAVTCPGPPATEGAGVPGRRRAFLVETGGPPCPCAGVDAAVGAADAGCLEEQLGRSGVTPSSSSAAVIADGVWGGALDNLGPFLRHHGGVSSARRGWAAGTASALWGWDGTVCARGNDVDLPTYVSFMASTLRDCGK